MSTRPDAEFIRAVLKQAIAKQEGKCYNEIAHVIQNTNCSKVIDEKTAVLDHLDNNPENNGNGNLHAVCRSCNTKKNPRGKSKRASRTRHKLHSSSLSFALPSTPFTVDPQETVRMVTTSAQLAVSHAYKQRFEEWFPKWMAGRERVTVDEVKNSAAMVIGCHQDWVGKRLDAYCSEVGDFQYVQGALKGVGRSVAWKPGRKGKYARG